MGSKKKGRRKRLFSQKKIRQLFGEIIVTSLSRKKQGRFSGEIWSLFVLCDFGGLDAHCGTHWARHLKGCQENVTGRIFCHGSHDTRVIVCYVENVNVRCVIASGKQRQVARLLEGSVSPSCGGTHLRTSAAPRTLCEISVVTEEKQVSGLREKTESEDKPQRHWTSISSVRTTEKEIDEGCKIDRTPEDGVLLIVPVVIKGKICKALIDSGATRCFCFPILHDSGWTSREEIRHIPRIREWSMCIVTWLYP